MDEAKFCQPAELVGEMQALVIRWFSAGRSIPEDLREVENSSPLRIERSSAPQRKFLAALATPPGEAQAAAGGASSLAGKLAGLTWQKLLRLPANGKQNAA
jgi:hypothetical protein